MLNVFTGVLLAILISPAAALAAGGGGGGAEPIPEVGYSDLPPIYHPSPSPRHIKHMNCCRRHWNTAHPG
jgi:hypothetical protein